MPRPFAPTRPNADPSALAARLLASLLTLALSSTFARAADMPMPTKAAAPAPVYDWTGCYVGLNGGGGASGSNVTALVVPGTYLGADDAAEVTNDGTGSHDTSNFLGGGQVGCNWQTQTLVVGLEGDFDYFHARSSFSNATNTLPVLGVPFTISQQATTDYIATLRPRVGVAADRNFAYVTGGVAFTRATYTESYADANAPPAVGTATATKSLTGWTAGAGWEYALTDHWLLRLEYLYASFPKTNATGVIVAPGVGTNALQGSSDLVIQVARAAMNFKF
jgi:outer membrane immunogenic protein